MKTGSNLVFLIDTSGSMWGEDKLDLAKNSMHILVDSLGDKDIISIVTYSGSFETLCTGLNAVSDRNELHKKINMLVASGCTNGSAGINEAYRVAEQFKDKFSNSRIIMCSDGDLNIGTTSTSELEKLVDDNKKNGVYLTILGFGSGNYKDNKMEALARRGNGNYYYIDCLREGYKVLSENVTSTLVTIADDVKFSLNSILNMLRRIERLDMKREILQMQSLKMIK